MTSVSHTPDQVRAATTKALEDFESTTGGVIEQLRHLPSFKSVGAGLSRFANPVAAEAFGKLDAFLLPMLHAAGGARPSLGGVRFSRLGLPEGHHPADMDIAVHADDGSFDFRVRWTTAHDDVAGDTVTDIEMRECPADNPLSEIAPLIASGRITREAGKQSFFHGDVPFGGFGRFAKAAQALLPAVVLNGAWSPEGGTNAFHRSLLEDERDAIDLDGGLPGPVCADIAARMTDWAVDTSLRFAAEATLELSPRLNDMGLDFGAGYVHWGYNYACAVTSPDGGKAVFQTLTSLVTDHRTSLVQVDVDESGAPASVTVTGFKNGAEALAAAKAYESGDVVLGEKARLDLVSGEMEIEDGFLATDVIGTAPYILGQHLEAIGRKGKPRQTTEFFSGFEEFNALHAEGDEIEAFLAEDTQFTPGKPKR